MTVKLVSRVAGVLALTLSPVACVDMTEDLT